MAYSPIGTMRKYNINANLVRTTEHLYDKATNAVQMNSSTREWFKTTAGVGHRMPSSIFFNILHERIMTDPVEEHDRKVSIDGRTISNTRTVDDIDALAEEEQEREALVE